MQVCGTAMLMGFSIASAAWFFLDAPSSIVFGIAALFAIAGLAGFALLLWISQPQK
jgi:uncharacterized membrane protein